MLIRSPNFMRCRHLGRVNFQWVLIPLRSVMYNYKGTLFILAYFFRFLLKELQKATMNFLLSVYLPVHPHETTGPHLEKLLCMFILDIYINMCEKV